MAPISPTRRPRERALHASRLERARASAPRGFEIGAAIVASVLPFAFALAHALGSPDLDRDRAVLRIHGNAATGLFRALDSLVARPVLMLPWSTPGLRAAAVSAAALAIFGLALYRIGIFVGRQIDPKPSAPEAGLRTLGALVGALLAAFATASQMEATVGGGATLGALLAVAPTWAWLEGRPGAPRTLRTALLFGLAATYEPAVAAIAGALLFPLVAAPNHVRSLRHPRFAFALSTGIFVAALPPMLALLRRRIAPELELPGGLFAHPLGESYQLGTHNPLPLVYRELGFVALGFAAVGTAFSLQRAPRLGFALVLACVVGGGAARLGASATETRAAAVVVAALGSLSVLAGVGMYAVAARVAGARIPFARASATLLVLLDLAIVARSADDAALALAVRARAPTDAWERSFGRSFTDGAIVLVPRRDIYEHALAARTRGFLGNGILLVPLFDTSGSAAITALRSEPRLGGVLRDVAIEGAPSEYALSELAAQREVDVVFDRTWSRNVARHFVPSGLVLRFSIEPRGQSDRRVAREAGLADLEALSASVKDHDDLRATTVSLLRLRAIGAAVADDREAMTLALADVRAVAPNDDLATRVAKPTPKVELPDPHGRVANAKR